MELSGDEIAGIADLFGGLTREELGQALAELAFKGGEEYDPAAFEGQVDEAIETYKLIRIVPEAVAADVQDPVFVPGPVAFPELPPAGEDLTHILDINRRDIDDSAGEIAAVETFREDVETALDAGESSRRNRLIDISYELEAWGAEDLSELRERLENA